MLRSHRQGWPRGNPAPPTPQQLSRLTAQGLRRQRRSYSGRQSQSAGMCAEEQQHYTEQRNEERGRATKTLLRL